MELLFELVQLAIGEKNKLSRVPTEKEWFAIYEMATMQSVTGLLFSAIKKMNEVDSSIKPPTELFLQWIGESLNIEAQNKSLNEAAKRLTEIFKEGQFRSCVLKGQGVARLYPDPDLRQPGDIDLWVDGSRQEILKFLKNKNFDIGHVVIHHVDCAILDDVLTEIHFIPVWAYNPFVNNRLQKFFCKHKEAQFCNYDVNKLSFNAFNEGTRLEHSIKMHKRLFKVDVKKIGGDTGYAGMTNRDLCKEKGIQTSFVKRGRPTDEKTEKDFVRQELARVGATTMEGSFGTQKEHYAMRRIKARKKKTEILDIFFGIHTANVVHLAERLAELEQAKAA